jgi:DNA invertase Pin-like site-specific DNA recombinase
VGQRAALYCRVSTADQSCDRQERDLRAFAKRSGFEIVGVYKEKASGAKTAKARGKRFGRQPGQRPSDRKAKKVLKLAEAGLSYRLIGRHVGLSKNTVGAILQRARAANQ